jgi:threonine/homoserine/homoserine lactone efflux protein
MPAHLPLFLMTTWLLAMLPGAGQALMLRQTLDGGRQLAWTSIAGTFTGLVLWSTAAAAGLSAVLLANPTAYSMVRIAGGIMLLGLGVNTLVAVSRSKAAVSAPEPKPLHLPSPWAGYGAGLATNLANPKAGVFAISLLPQFVTTNGPVFLSTLALGTIWALVTACWYVLFTWTVDRGRALVSKPEVLRGLQFSTGAVLSLLGIAVAAGL